MRTALRTAIATALVAGVAVTTPALTAGAAFAADGPATTVTNGPGTPGTATVTPAATTTPTTPASPSTPAAPSATATATSSATATPSATPTPTATATTAPTASATPTAPATTAPATDTAKGTLVRTEKLAGGYVAKIYKVAAGHHRADFYLRGEYTESLTADGRSVAGNDNGTFFVLTPGGATHHWVGNYIPGARSGVYRLADGTVVQLDRKGGVPGLQLLDNGVGRGYTYVASGRQVLTYGKAVVILEEDGGFAAYVPGSARQAAPQLLSGAPAPTAGTPVVIGECTVRQDIPSVFAQLTVTLTHDLEKGPKAVLKDEQGKPVVTVDRAHPADTGMGLTISGAHTLTPKLGQRTQGGDTPYAWTAFPKLPKGCEKPTSSTTRPATGTGGTGTGPSATGGQTSVIPKGGVAAGAELGTTGESTALVATGAGAASLAAAGLGFLVVRRRAAGRA